MADSSPPSSRTWSELKRNVWDALPTAGFLVLTLTAFAIIVYVAIVVLLGNLRTGVAVIVGLLPAVLVLQHGLYLLASKPYLIASVRPSNKDDEAVQRDFERDAPYRQKAQAEADRQFGFQSVAFDYFVPTLLTAGVGVISMLYAIPGANPGAEESLATNGVVWGSFGAYVYVLMMLGERTFQRDITPGAAIWSSVQLVLGPILGGLLGTGVLDNLAAGDVSKHILYFFAGLGPRPLVNFIQQIVRNALSRGNVAKVRSIPLQTIRGIDQRIEDRLFEEGITDGYLLAMANPIRLHRTTPFDLRQIVSWIDECILYAVLPARTAETIQESGICGAMDLAYYWEMREPANPPANPETVPLLILAERLHLEDTQMLRDVVRRLYEDSQVRLIWSLYQSMES